MDRSPEKLRALLQRIDGRGYKAYKELNGRWDFPNFMLFVDHVQGDPFASPSRLRALVPGSVARFDLNVISTESRRVGVSWLLARRFASAARDRSQSRGSGKSGQIQIAVPGQEVLPQTATMIHGDGLVEARFTVGLPARGRSVLGRQAATLLLECVPDIVASSLKASSYDDVEIWQHATTNEDADHLRTVLSRRNLIAFVADGAILPRLSGVDNRPLQRADAIPFSTPPSLRHTLTLPHTGEVSGMGISQGVTLIVGGGYHGKSTLLRAIERGVYNHCPGDGRELVVSQADLVKIRAEDGRSVSGVNISPFIANLPLAQETTQFSTINASGSTSQAAAIMEALEVGATGLIIDEDTAATNFMIRDARMQALIPKEHEPITPLIDRVRQLYEERGISTILVMGGSGDYLDVADTVIAMHNFCPRDVTAEARLIAGQHPGNRVVELGDHFPQTINRHPLPQSIDASRGRRAADIKVRAPDRIQFGNHDIDLSCVEQLVAAGQTQAIAQAIWYASRSYVDGNRPFSEIIQQVCQDVDTEGLDVLDQHKVGNLAQFRPHELAAAINRLRSLEVRSI